MGAALRVAIASLLVVCVTSGAIGTCVAAPRSDPAVAAEAAQPSPSVEPPGATQPPAVARAFAGAQPPAWEQAPAAAQPPAGAPQSSTQLAGSAVDAREVPVVSIERIRALLAAGSIFGVERLSPDDLRPVYRSRVEERAFKLPDFVATLDTGFEAVPPGGLTQYEINRLITPDMYRGMAVFSNKEVLRVMALALRNALLLRGLGWAVDKGKDAWDNRQVERIRDEIRREIATIEEENRRKAGGIKRPVSRP